MVVGLDVRYRYRADELAKFKRPGKLVLREAPLPRNATGKLLKGEIRNTIEARARRYPT